MNSDAIVYRRTACNRDCPDACGIVASIQNGKVVRLQGDREHPVTRGFLCHRTSRFLDRQYDPNRLTSPLVRRGNGFEPISWEEALDMIAGKMLAIRDESGGAAILHYRCGGSLGIGPWSEVVNTSVVSSRPHSDSVARISPVDQSISSIASP